MVRCVVNNDNLLWKWTMLRANVGLSRKLSKDYNSTGYSINLDGEITASVSDPEAVIEQVKELFDLAEETLNQQVDRAQSEAAIASHDAEPSQQIPNRIENDSHQVHGHGNATKTATSPKNDNDLDDPPATNKQLQYLLSIGKRRKLSTTQLEMQIAEILGRPVAVYELSKQAAGVVIDALTTTAAANSSATR